MANKYTYHTYSKQTCNGVIPLHIVEIHHKYLASFAVFNTAKHAIGYIINEKKRAERYGITIEYDPDMEVSQLLLKTYLTTNGQFFTKLNNKQVYISKIYQ